MPVNKLNQTAKLPVKPLTSRGADPVIWGVGPDGRVYKWNGVLWEEPNPLARLSQVSVAKTGASIMGIGADGRVYFWNGSAWSEPSPSTRLFDACNLNGSEAWAIDNKNKLKPSRLFRTTQAGIKWDPMYPGLQLKQISTSSFLNTWGITVQNLVGYIDTNTHLWVYVPTPGLIQISAFGYSVGGAWGLSADNRIYRTIDGLNWEQPNTNARLYQIAAGGDDLYAWGIGNSGRVFRTVDGGKSWEEPNTYAGLKQISVGY